MEPLESRVMLAAAGLVPVGEQPEGGLSGKIVYTRAGHGWNWNSNVGRWATDRGNTNSIVEDFGNQDQTTPYIDYLLRAGATVVPLRPVGHQLNEVVLDNDSPGVTWSGSWSTNTTGPRWYDEDYGAGLDNDKYRFAASNAAETSVATYTPSIPGEGGFYPVYAWASHGGNRTDQLYKINHTGGQTQIRVDHRMVGNGWVYLGTYHFNGGSSVAEGSVQISNQSAVAGNVIADAIRFGNGMGDLPWNNSGVGSGSISGYSREDEGSLPWVWRGIGQGVSPSTVLGTSNVTASTRMAEHMTPSTNPFGSSLLVSFHSNAGGGAGRGSEGLIHSINPTPNQIALASYLSNQINSDLIARNGQFEYNWIERRDYAAGEYGEINDTWINGKFDATIIETSFHDNVMDSAIMLDPLGRDQMARSTYEGTLEYFINFGNGVKPANVTLPSAPINARAVSNAGGQVTVSWSAGPSSNNGVAGVYGNAAAGYRIYASTNGYGFDGGTYVAGGGTASVTLSGYDPTMPYYFKVVAENAGGQSLASEVMVAVPNGGPKQVLIVNGYDRIDREQNFRQPYAFGGTYADRVRPRYNNTFDYVAQVASAIQTHAPETSIDSTSNELVASGAVNLSNYAAVIWILGEESTADETFSASEQTRVSTYLSSGGKLFVTGSELAWDLDGAGTATAADRAFLNNVLKADFSTNDANAYAANPSVGGIFSGLPQVTFDNGAKFYDVDAPDSFNATGGSTAAMSYTTGGVAALQYADALTGAKVVAFGFPFETITTANLRTQVMGRVLDYFAVTELPDEIETILDNDDGPGVYSETGTWTTAGATGYNGLTYRFASTGTAATAQWQFFAPFAGLAELYVQHRAASNRADNATFEINTGSGVETASVNQKNDLLVWVPLGEFYFEEGARTITLNAQTSTGGSVVIADAIRVVLFNAPEPTGDFNDDGATDGADFLVWQRNVATTEPELSDGDGNGDNAVDADDLELWRANFGSQTAAVSSASLAATSASFAAEADAASAQSLLEDMAAIAQRVAASAALERFSVRKPVEREVAAAWADGRRRTLDASMASDLAFLRRNDVERPAPREEAFEANQPDAAHGFAELDRALERHVAKSWRNSL